MSVLKDHIQQTTCESVSLSPLSLSLSLPHTPHTHRQDTEPTTLPYVEEADTAPSSLQLCVDYLSLLLCERDRRAALCTRRQFPQQYAVLLACVQLQREVC
jgi:hypothetical protein